MRKSATQNKSVVGISGDLQIFTYEEAAAVLKMSRRQVLRACEEGRLGYTMLNGRGRRITSEHIRAYVERGNVDPAA